MSRPARGLFLAVEGGEGSGKSTQVEMLAAWMRGRGRTVTVAREPGSTPLGERIRATVLGQKDLAVPARSELFLMLAARAAFVEQLVDPALARGEVVISDRFEMSSFAYQGAGRGLPLDEVRAINRFATGGRTPELTILLDVDPGEGATRQGRQGKRPDRMEAETRQFHQRVRTGYLELAEADPHAVVIPADGSPGEVHGSIVAALRPLLAETFEPAGVTDIRSE